MMKFTRHYEPYIENVGNTMLLSESVAHHVVTVLRKKVGDLLTLFSGDNTEYLVKIVSIQRKKVFVYVSSKTFVSRESPRDFYLAQALLKTEKMDWVIQKAVELGTKAIFPFFSERTNVFWDTKKALQKINHFQSVAISACEQCGRNEVPVVHLPIPLKACIEQQDAHYKILLSPNSSHTWRDVLPGSDPICLFVGPEGGFSSEEEMLLKTYHALFISLGPRILRTETAGFCAQSILQASFGDL